MTHIARVWLVALAAMWLADAAYAADYGRFVQSRQVEFLPKPIVSTGRYLLNDDAGLLWVTETPIYSELRIVGEDIRERTGADQPWSAPLLGAAEAAVFGRLLAALVAADRRALEEFFRIEAHSNDAHWNWLLVPRQQALAEKVPQFEVRGHQENDGTALRVQGLQWHDTYGSQTAVELIPLADEPPPEWSAVLRDPPATKIVPR